MNTVPVPFTLLSVVANHCNEDYIALNGLKDCYVMYLSENGQTKQELLIQQQNTTTTTTTTQPTVAPTEQNSTQTTIKQKTVSPSSQLPQLNSNSAGLIVLHPSLEGSNYIIKSIWLPGSQTELALITSEFIKIYDLSVDKISPIYYYLLPIGKIKDVTFVYDLKATDYSASTYKQIKHIVIMSSCGYLYYEEMNEVTSAKNGIYYITNTIEFQYENQTTVSSSPSQKPTSDKTPATNMFGGGVSVYFSFKLGLLFWSYQQGKTFTASFKQHSLILDKVFPLILVYRVHSKTSQ